MKMSSTVGTVDDKVDLQPTNNKRFGGDALLSRQRFLTVWCGCCNNTMIYTIE